MLSAVAADFLSIREYQVHVIVADGVQLDLDERIVTHRARTVEERSEKFDELVCWADETVLIAPEFRGTLLGLSKQVREQGGKLLSPSPEFVSVASDKQSTIERLFAAKVAVPKGQVLMPGERCPLGVSYPAVVKPIDGCGSLGVELVQEGHQLSRGDGAYRLEERVRGLPVSVLCICGAEQTLALEPCLQCLAGADDFAYQGGALPLEEHLRARAAKLALSAVHILPPTQGLVGVDLVLGEAEDGSEDFVIEVNPRCTTSYVGLRAAYDVNLAELVLVVSNGGQVTPPEISRPVKWNAAGEVSILD